MLRINDVTPCGVNDVLPSAKTIQRSALIYCCLYAILQMGGDDMKKFLCILLSISCFLSLVACYNTNDNNQNLNNSQNIEEPAQKIGLITDFDSFKTEMSKRLELSKYIFSYEPISSTLNSYKYELYEQEPSTKTSNFVVEIDGIQVTLPIRIEDLLKKGFSITEINFEPVYYLNLESNLSFGTLKVVTPKGNNFLAYAINPGENYQGKMKDCLITQVDAYYYENGSNFETDFNPLVPDMKYFNSITKDSTLDDIINELGYPSFIEYSTAEYKGEITISTIQLRYDFSNVAYKGHTYITVETLKNHAGIKKNLIFSISYVIEYPTQ